MRVHLDAMQFQIATPQQMGTSNFLNYEMAAHCTAQNISDNELDWRFVCKLKTKRNLHIISSTDLLLLLVLRTYSKQSPHYLQLYYKLYYKYL